MLVDSGNRMELLPLDRGLTFGWGNKGLWLQVAIFFSVLDGIMGVLLSSTESGALQLLVFLPVVLTHCWFISAVVNLTILRMRGNLGSGRLGLGVVLPHVFSSFAIVPKVLFALIMVIIVYGMGFPISPLSLPLWFVGVLFSWAPFFVAADASIPEEKKNQRSKSVEEEMSFFGSSLDDDDDDDEGTDPGNFTNYFVGRPLWDLGINRSVRFSLSQMSLTLYLVWLTVLAITLPVAILSATFGLDEGSIGVILHAVIEPVVLAFILGSLTSALVYGLPEESRDELGISESAMEELQTYETSGRVLRLQGRLFSNIVIFAVSMLSIAGVVSYMMSVTAIPQTASISLLRVEEAGADLKITVSVLDVSERYTWLEPQMFVLGKREGFKSGPSGVSGSSGISGLGISGPPKPAELRPGGMSIPDSSDSSSGLPASSDTSSDSSIGELAPILDPVPPTGVEVLNFNSTTMSLADFASSRGGIKMVLTFSKVSKFDLDGRSLFYQRIPGFGSVVSSSLNVSGNVAY